MKLKALENLSFPNASLRLVNKPIGFPFGYFILVWVPNKSFVTVLTIETFSFSFFFLFLETRVYITFQITDYFIEDSHSINTRLLHGKIPWGGPKMLVRDFKPNTS